MEVLMPINNCIRCDKEIDPTWWSDKMCRPCQIAWIMEDAGAWLHWCRENCKAPRGEQTYLVTFTKRADMDVEKWLARIKFELRRKFVKEVSAVIEHADSNVHCHAKIRTATFLKKSRDYKTYIKAYGFVDIRNVKYDNGVDEYLAKEGKVFTNVEDISI